MVGIGGRNASAEWLTFVPLNTGGGGGAATLDNIEMESDTVHGYHDSGGTASEVRCLFVNKAQSFDKLTIIDSSAEFLGNALVRGEIWQQWGRTDHSVVVAPELR